MKQIIKIEENREYTREELKDLYNDSPTTIEYKTYPDENVKRTFGFLEQGKEILIKNYPWGFRLKTTIKYWVEVTKRGSRFCRQKTVALARFTLLCHK